MVGLPDCRSFQKSGPFATQSLFDHSKSRLGNHLNNGLVCYSNGRFGSGCQMVCYSNHGLKTGLKKAVNSLNDLPSHMNLTPILSGIQVNPGIQMITDLDFRSAL